jgi:hypothetical protein
LSAGEQGMQGGLYDLESNMKQATYFQDTFRRDTSGEMWLLDIRKGWQVMMGNKSIIVI